MQGTGFEIKPSEINIIKIYRSLDNQGKKVIDFLLESELNRYREIQEMQQQIIANNEEINLPTKNFNSDEILTFLDQNEK